MLLISIIKVMAFLFFGHTRMVTSGSEKFDYNNQPIIKNGVALIHNGINAAEALNTINNAFSINRY